MYCYCDLLNVGKRDCFQETRSNNFSSLFLITSRTRNFVEYTTYLTLKCFRLHNNEIITEVSKGQTNTNLTIFTDG